MKQRWEYLLLDWANHDFRERSRMDCAKDPERATLYFHWNTKTYMTWLQVISKDTLYCLEEDTSGVVLKTVSRQLLPFTLTAASPFCPTTQSSPGTKAFLPLVSFVINILIRLDFLLPFSNSHISQWPKLQAASHHAGIVRHWQGAGQDIPGVEAVLSLDQNHCFWSHVAQLHHSPSEPSRPPNHKSSSLFLFVNCVGPWRDVV